MSALVITECDHDSFEPERAVAAAAGLDFRIEQCADAAAVAERCRDAAGLLVQYASIDGPLMDELPSLAVISRYGVGVDSVDVEAATARGIAVCNVPDYGTEAVSDHAIALALAVARGLGTLDSGVRQGRFDLPAVRPLFQIRGRTFGVLGLGRIGQAVARKAAGLGYRVIGHDVLATPGTAYAGVEAVTLPELLSRSQVLSLHTPLTPATRHLIGAAELAAMRPDCVLVNTSRGAVVDTDALVEALMARRIAGAGIDVHETEPLSADHPLTRTPATVLTPHLAWYSEESYTELKRRTAQNAADAVLGRRPANLVNPEALERKVR
jgi:D-3-phosphoglycerate dehydrogenase